MSLLKWVSWNLYIPESLSSSRYRCQNQGSSNDTQPLDILNKRDVWYLSGQYFIYCSFYRSYVSGSWSVVTHESVFVPLGCLYKPVDNLTKMLNAAGEGLGSDSPRQSSRFNLSRSKEEHKSTTEPFKDGPFFVWHKLFILHCLQYVTQGKAM